MLKRVKNGIYVLFALSLCLLLGSSSSYALTQASTNYKFNESTIGSGGLVQSSSANYQGRDSLGDIAIGTSFSSNYQVASGSITPFDPVLSVSVSNVSDFGQLSAGYATTATATLTISNYTTYGYVAQIYGTTMTASGGATIPAMGTSTPAASVPGSSQFGINLVANTSPAVGTNPNNGQFGYGTVPSNYNQTNKFRYVSGETIAQATKNSGLTTYTISFLVNVAGITARDTYTSSQTIIVTGTY